MKEAYNVRLQHRYMQVRARICDHYFAVRYSSQGSPQEIKVEWCGILIFINIDHELIK